MKTQNDVDDAEDSVEDETGGKLHKRSEKMRTKKSETTEKM